MPCEDEVSMSNVPQRGREYEATIGSLGLTASAFDAFGLKQLLGHWLGKCGSHVAVDTPELIEALCMQVLTVPHQSMSGTGEFYTDRPLGVLLGRLGVTCQDLGRAVLSRMLDEVYAASPDRLFTICAARVAERIGVKPVTLHIDSTSFHYDGMSRIEDGVPVVLDQGYSRDSHPELNQIISVMMTEEMAKIPLFQKCFSGNVSDKTSFLSTLSDDLPFIKQQFKELRYVIGDSAFCTSKIANEAAKQGIWFVTRIPDTNKEASDCIAQAMEHPEMLSHVDPDDPASPMAMWSGNGKIGEQDVVKLTVRNEKLEARKRETVGKHARKELEALEKKLRKLRTRPCKCQADAEKCVAELRQSLRLCAITNVSYEEVRRHKHSGRPAPGDKGDLVAVAVKAEAAVSDELVEEAVNRETYYVVCTNDTGREWTMKDLLATYKRQSVIERNWRCLKDHRILTSSFYLEKPSRICALMWLLSLALLVYAATEYLMRKAMRERGLSIHWTDGRTEMEQPSLMRMYTYMTNCGIRVHINAVTGAISITGLRKEIYAVLEAMGPDWTRYYQWQAYVPQLEALRVPIGF